MKKLLVFSLILLSTLFVSCFFISSNAKADMDCGPSATWTYDESTKTLYVSGTGAITDTCYYRYPGVTNLVIGEGIEEIGKEAFTMCQSLVNVSLPSTLKTIGEMAFDSCFNLKSIDIPDSVTHIGYRAFGYCLNMESINLSKNLEVLSDGAFYECRKLKTIDIPDKVTTLYTTSFTFCGSLVSMRIGKGVQKVIAEVHDGNPVVKYVIFTGSAPYIDKFAFYNYTTTIYYPSGDSSWNGMPNKDWPNSTLIWVGVEDPMSIKPETEGDTETGICGQKAYWEYKDGVLHITGSGDVTSAPWQHLRLDVVEVIVDDTITGLSADGAFIYFENLEKVYLSKNLETLGHSAFAYTKIKEITIPDKVKVIEGSTFEYCKYLEIVNLPKGLEQIDYSAFLSCKNLKVLNLPESLSLFYVSSVHGTAIEELRFPASLNCINPGNIGEEWSGSLKRLYFMGNPPTMASNLFEGFSGDIYVHEGLEEWAQYDNYFVNAQIEWHYVDCPHFFDKWDSNRNEGHSAECTVCGEIVNSEHEWIETVDKEATCLESGTAVKKCVLCNHVKSYVLEKRAHTYDSAWNSDETQHWKVCQECGQEAQNENHQGDGECTVCGVVLPNNEPDLTPTPEPGFDFVEETNPTTIIDACDDGEDTLWIIISVVAGLIVVAGIVFVIVYKK